MLDLKRIKKLPVSGILNKTFNLVNFSNQLINRFANCNIPLQLLKLILYIKPRLFIQKTLLKLGILHLLF
jgi:hypothetical protein